MAWTYNDTTSPGVLTSAGATEAAPDSLLAGIAIVQAANATRGYRDNNNGWLRDVRINYSNSCFVFDNFSFITFYGSTFVAESGNGGWIGGAAAVLDLRTTTARSDSTACISTGGYVLTRKLRPQDPSFRIIYSNSVRHDFPTMQTNRTPAKIDIDGIDFYGNGGSAFLKSYFGRATNFVKSKGLRMFGSGPGLQFMQSTYDDLYSENMGLEGEGGNTDVVFNRPTFWRSAAAGFGGSIRGGRVAMWNPTFLNSCWSRAIGFAVDRNAGSLFFGGYTFKSTFLSGLAPIEGVNVRFSRARQSLTGASTWTAPGEVATAVSNASGTFTAVQLLDWYSAGTTQTAIEFFNWTAKARAYDKRTAGETVFASRVLYQASVNMSAGYSEEVQMLDVAGLTLTQAQAAALTGIAFAASGATGGTVTVTEPRTTAEIWAAYRNWISQTANFDSSDSWLFDGETLNLGDWDMAGAGPTTGNIETNGVVIGTVNGSVKDANGAQVTIRTSDSLPLSTYLTVNGVPQAWQVGQTARALLVQPTDVVRIYAHASGYQPKIVNVTGDTASDYVLSLLPETNVDTTLDTTTRNAIAAGFAVGVDALSRLFLSVSFDMRPYSPPAVLNALHYFTVTQGAMIAAAAVAANSVAGFALQRGGFIIRSPGFYGKVADSVTTTGPLGILVPLAISVDPSVYVALPSYSPVELNTSGIVLQYAPWTMQEADLDTTRLAGAVWETPASDHTLSTTMGGKVNASASGGVDLAALADAVWANDERTLTAGASSGGVTLAEIEASTVLAKEATVASRASQASITALGAPLQSADGRLDALDAAISTRLAASAYVAPAAAPTAADNAAAVRTSLETELGRIDAALSSRATQASVTALTTATLTEHDATQAAIASLPAPLTSAQAQAAAAAALVAYDAVMPADLVGLATAAQVTAIGSPLQAGDYVAPANADIAAIKAKTDTLTNAPSAADIWENPTRTLNGALFE